MSGGHAQHFKGDLTMSFRAYKVFPFIVECKHRATWKPLSMFDAGVGIHSFFQQVTVAQSKEEDVLRLVIMRGNATAIYVAFSVKEVAKDLRYNKLLLATHAGLHFKVDGEEWKMTLFNRFLKRVAIITKKEEKAR